MTRWERSGAVILKSAGQRPPDADRVNLLRSLLDHPLVRASAYIGGALYFLFSLIYDLYFSRIGLTADDVGLDKAAVLSRAAAGVIMLFGVAVVVAAWRVLVASLVWVTAKLHQRSLDN